MKHFIFLISFLFVITGASYAQSNVTDSHPEVGIYVIDYSTGQKIQVNYDTAILFKDAFVDLVLSTDIAERESRKRFPGEKQLFVEQLDPQTGGNAYKLELQSKDRNNNMTFTIYTFVYNADNNTLTFLNQQYQRYEPVQIDSQNQNLNNCYSYGLFNAQGQQQDSYAQNTADVQTEAPVDVDVTANIAPPEMPEYQQPECPADGYQWQPGYWGYNPGRTVYYWVPGAWVAPPSNGVVWTPPYWGYEGSAYIFHAGYWGEHVGFYGGINYGYGYSGHGFYGGEWRDNHYHYNTAVTHVNTTVVHNTYINNTVVVNNTVIDHHHSFNGAGGVVAKPTQIEIVAVHERHEMPTPEQNRNQQLARVDKNQFVTPGSDAKPANVAVERVPVKPVNNPQQIRVGFQGNNNARPGMNQQPNQNGATFRPRDPANNSGMRPGINQQPNQNGSTVVTREPAANGGMRPETNPQPNQNGGRVGVTQPANNGPTTPAVTEPANQNGGRVGVTPPANNNGNRPGNTEPNNQNNGRVGTTPPAGNSLSKPSMNPTPGTVTPNTATPVSTNPTPAANNSTPAHTPATSGTNAAPATNNTKAPAATPGAASNNAHGKTPGKPAGKPNPQNKKIKQDN
jgi:hypothetical protein